MLKDLIPDKLYYVSGSMLYAFSPIILGNVIFIRMYVMLSTFVLLLTWWNILWWNKAKSTFFYVALGLITVGGVLTHYYFLIYLFFVCATNGITLLINKKIREIVGIFITMILSGVTCYGGFPAMKYHIFHGSRGVESFDRLLHSSYISSFKYFFEGMNHVAGGMLLFFILMPLVSDHHRSRGDFQSKWIIVFLPMILYFLTISKIAVMYSTRYISIFYGICDIGIIGIIWWLIKENNGNRYKKFIVIGIIALILNNEWMNYSWSELYEEEAECISISEKYGDDNEVIYVYEDSGHCVPNYNEFVKYKTISFVSCDNLSVLFDKLYQNYEHVVIYFDKSIGDILIYSLLDMFLSQNANLETYTELFSYQYSVAYYLE